MSRHRGVAAALVLFGVFILVPAVLVTIMVALNGLVNNDDDVADSTFTEGSEEASFDDITPDTNSDKSGQSEQEFGQPEQLSATTGGDRNEQPTDPSSLPPLPDTTDPDAYAIGVAEVLFGMDSTQYDSQDYKSLLVDSLWSDILPEDRTDIAAVIAERIPDPHTWAEMAEIQQRSEFEADDVWEPEAGQEVIDDPTLPAGMVLRTVSGSQTDFWQESGQSEEKSSYSAIVSMVVACPPATSPCALVGIFPEAEV